MSKKQIIVIDGFKYEITKMKLRTQWKVFASLSKMLAPALKGIGAGQNPLDVDTDDLKKAFDVANMIAALTERFDEDHAYSLIEKMFACVYSVSYTESEIDAAKKGSGLLEADRIDVHFSDEDGLIRMLKLAGECIKFNFGGVVKKFKSSKVEENETETESQTK